MAWVLLRTKAIQWVSPSLPLLQTPLCQSLGGDRGLAQGLLSSLPTVLPGLVQGAGWLPGEPQFHRLRWGARPLLALGCPMSLTKVSQQKPLSDVFRFLNQCRKILTSETGIIGIFLFVAEFRNSKIGKHKGGHGWTFHWNRWHNFQSLEEVINDFLPRSPEETLASHLTLLSGK